MRCTSCGEKINPNFSFCDSCGTPITTTSPAQQPVAVQTTAAAAPKVSTASAPSNALHLTTWAGLRWLLATNYGHLSLTDTHLNHNLTKFWANDIYSIIVKIFNWGFDWPSSLFKHSGSTSLKSVTSVRIFALDWISWKGHFLFIFAGGLPDVYVFSTKQLSEVEAFVATLKKAASDAKYNTK